MSREEITLENAVVTLAPIQLQDEPGYASIAFDPTTWAYFVYRIDTPEELAEFVAASVRATQSGERTCYTIRERRTGTIAGTMSFGNDSPRDRRIEIGWSWLGASYRGTTINKYAKLALLQHAFETKLYDRVEFKTDVLNGRARRALKKIGATEEGVLRSHTLMPGARRRDTIYYSILRAEWPDLKQRVFGL
jgi:RimJ/RimL family protein N-acetyltransferase